MRSSYRDITTYTSYLYFSFFFNDSAPTQIYSLSLHDALPIFDGRRCPGRGDARRRHAGGPGGRRNRIARRTGRSEEHTSELQSPCNLVCRLLLEKKKNEKHNN